MRPLDCDCNHAAQGVECPQIEGAPCVASMPTGFVPSRSGTSSLLRPIANHDVAAVGPLRAWYSSGPRSRASA